MIAWEELVSTLGLAAHPEGGYFREIYRSPELLSRASLPARFGGERAASTAIYFLLPRGTFSALHTIASDECWHHYGGGPLRIVALDPSSGAREDLLLGADYARGERPFQVVPAGRIFGARPEGEAPYALVGCTVAPGFDFADFRLEARADLLTRFPEHAGVVAELTRV